MSRLAVSALMLLAVDLCVRRGEFLLTCVPEGRYVIHGDAGVGIKGHSQRFQVKDDGKPAVVEFRIKRR